MLYALCLIVIVKLSLCSRYQHSKKFEREEKIFVKITKCRVIFTLRVVKASSISRN